MFPKILCGLTGRIIRGNVRPFSVLQQRLGTDPQPSTWCRRRALLASGSEFPSRRFKRTSKQRKDESDSEDEEEEEETEDNDEVTGSIITKNVPSVRLENVVKTALGLSRRKVEDAFFEGKIRVNGKQISKKNVQLNIGDEVDVVISKSSKNPDLLMIHRAKLLGIAIVDDNIQIKVTRDKNLLVEEYEDF